MCLQHLSSYKNYRGADKTNHRNSHAKTKQGIKHIEARKKEGTRIRDIDTKYFGETATKTETVRERKRKTQTEGMRIRDINTKGFGETERQEQRQSEGVKEKDIERRKENKIY